MSHLKITDRIAIILSILGTLDTSELIFFGYGFRRTIMATWKRRT
jgi:hypothetical protein